MRTAKYEDSEGSFRLVIPDGWEYTTDEDGGLLISRGERGGLLHVLPFAREDAEEVDPAEELYAFLEDREIELEEDEVEDVELDAGGTLALCEYVEENGEEDEGEAVYWMVGVTTGPGQLVFANFSCALGEEEEDREVVRRILASLTFAGPAPAPGA